MEFGIDSGQHAGGKRSMGEDYGRVGTGGTLNEIEDRDRPRASARESDRASQEDQKSLRVPEAQRRILSIHESQMR